MVHQTTSATVGDLVHDLAAAFDRSAQLYAQWRARRERANHYHRPRAGDRAGSSGAGAARCALAASLALGQHVREVYTVGLGVLGSDFSRGDHAARRALAAPRDLLLDQAAALRAAVPAAAGPLDLRALLQASEAARVAAVQALVDQYRRMALARPDVPRDLPVPRWRPGSSSRTPSPAPGAAAAAPSARWLTYLDDDARTTAWSVLSGPLVFQSEPPSPPLTPKDAATLPPVPPLPPAAFRAGPSSAVSPLAVAVVAAVAAVADNSTDDRADDRTADDRTDLESAYGGAPSTAATARPKNSVFHIFCPGAMALQVDVRRPVPAGERSCRWCGFRWDGDASSTPSAGHHALLLKEGFHLSRRFLAKSHCEGGDTGAGTAPGSVCYGCVLCTSAGVAQTYATAEALRVHINAAHSKWQMLHDRDLTG